MIRLRRARPETDWTHHWTIADCVKHFGCVPQVFRLIDPTSKVSDIWHYLTIGMQSRLDFEFTYYDVMTGRV